MKERIRVCHFSSVHSINDTRVFHRECVSLAKRFDVTLIAIGNVTGMVEGVNVIGIKKPRNRIYRMLFTTLNVFIKAIRTKSTIYHIHDSELLLYGILLAIAGKKVIYDIHENTRGDIMQKSWIPGFSRHILLHTYKSLEWVASRFMHFIPVVGKEALAHRVCHLNRYTIIQNFASLEQCLPYRETNRNNLVGNHLFYVGTMHDDYYDMNKVIDAIAGLKERGIVIHFHCVGYNKSYKEKSLPLSRYNEIKDQVHFYGQLSFAEAYEISKKCKVGLCLKNQSDEILLSHERKFFEYLAVGLPVLTCDALLYKEMITVDQTGETVDLSDSSAIETKLAYMFSPSTDLNSMATHAIAAATEKYNWESEEKKLIGLYEDLLKSQNA